MADDSDSVEVPEWIVTYGDMMSLLLTFFIMLVSLSEVVADKKYRAVLASLQSYTGYRTAPKGPPGNNFPLNSLIKRLETLGSFTNKSRAHGGVRIEAPLGADVRVFRTADGTSIRVGRPVPFNRIDARLSPAARKQLKQIKLALVGKPNKIEILGHVSPEPLPADTKPVDKMLLSYRRGRTVLRFLAKNGVRIERMRISAIGDQQPVESSGETRSQIHDRVEIHIVDKFIDYFQGASDSQ